MYIYPEHLRARATLWLWELRSLAAIGVGGLLSVLVLSQLGSLLPMVLTCLYAFLSIRLEDTSVMGFLLCAARFLILRQQRYERRKEL